MAHPLMPLGHDQLSVPSVAACSLVSAPGKLVAAEAVVEEVEIAEVAEYEPVEGAEACRYLEMVGAEDQIHQDQVQIRLGQRLPVVVEAFRMVHLGVGRKVLRSVHLLEGHWTAMDIQSANNDQKHWQMGEQGVRRKATEKSTRLYALLDNWPIRMALYIRNTSSFGREDPIGYSRRGWLGLGMHCWEVGEVAAVWTDQDVGHRS